MENNIKITYPESEKVYMRGKLFPEIKVGMRLVRQMPTVTVEDGRRMEHPNPPVYIYDTSGPYSDPSVETDVRKGLPRLREPWNAAEWKGFLKSRRNTDACAGTTIRSTT